ncbi:hypothetical protein MIR68_008041 [Amoeboaphelidium protococcarum]|nr:hypothetical protein MIR68_008041 [Amoeboaphelidium protococcarum]
MVKTDVVENDKVVISTVQQDTNATNNATTSKIQKKKRKLSKKQRLAKQANDETAVSEEDLIKNAVEYLQLWNDDRQKWKFQKNRQHDLLAIAFDKEKLRKSDFKILCKYIQGLQGGARDRLVSDSTEIVSKFNQGDQEDSAPVDKAAKRRYKRAKKILKVLRH